MSAADTTIALFPEINGIVPVLHFPVEAVYDAVPEELFAELIQETCAIQELSEAVPPKIIEGEVT